MYLVRLVLTSQDHPHPTPADAARVQDILWAHAVPSDGVEHLRCIAARDRVDLVVFLRGPECPVPPFGPALAVLCRLVAPLAAWQAALPADP